MKLSPVEPGLDRLARRNFDRLVGRKYGVLCNQCAVTADLRHILRHNLPPGLSAIFGPQHGVQGHTQANMIEWEGNAAAPIPIYSLYGEYRRPTKEMLAGLDLLVIDLPDIGSRYYTYAWTTTLAVEACREYGVEALILDRPNPLGGMIQEGPVNQLTSFVGLRHIPIRHGMTLGEIARLTDTGVAVEEVIGWDRRMLFPETGLHWIMPSPNMPDFHTALVYPGGCLLEATAVSEGRGTTRPFEIFGAPELNENDLADDLNSRNIPGVFFRPIQFAPTFDKFAGTLCSGCFVHVTDRSSFPPVRTYVHIIEACFRRLGNAGFWLPPPYEYEYERMPIDILWGSSWLREAIEHGNLDGLDEELVREHR